MLSLEYNVAILGFPNFLCHWLELFAIKFLLESVLHGRSGRIQLFNKVVRKKKRPNLYYIHWKY